MSFIKATQLIFIIVRLSAFIEKRSRFCTVRIVALHMGRFKLKSMSILGSWNIYFLVEFIHLVGFVGAFRGWSWRFFNHEMLISNLLSSLIVFNFRLRLPYISFRWGIWLGSQSAQTFFLIWISQDRNTLLIHLLLLILFTFLLLNNFLYFITSIYEVFGCLYSSENWG